MSAEKTLTLRKTRGNRGYYSEASKNGKIDIKGNYYIIHMGPASPRRVG